MPDNTHTPLPFCALTTAEQTTESRWHGQPLRAQAVSFTAWPGDANTDHVRYRGGPADGCLGYGWPTTIVAPEALFTAGPDERTWVGGMPAIYGLRDGAMHFLRLARHIGLRPSTLGGCEIAGLDPADLAPAAA